MAIFSYRAMNSEGRIQRGETEAQNIIDLELRLKRMELDLIAGAPAKRPLGLAQSRTMLRERIQFCFHLEQLTRAGVPILDALTDLRDSTEIAPFRSVIGSVIESIIGGRSFSQALSEQGHFFSPVFCALIRAGEQSGNLPEVLHGLTESFKREDELRAFLGKLLIYPSIVLTVIGAAVIIMLLFVVPQLTRLFAQNGQTLPLQTRLLMGLSSLLAHYWPLLLTGLSGSAIGLFAWIKSSRRAALWWDNFRLTAPLVGKVYRKIVLARFANLFAMMYGSGIPIIDTLRTAQDAVGNLALRTALEQVEQNISEGQNVSTAFTNAQLFPPLVLRMLRVGEHTGELEHALRSVSYFFERDVEESINRLQAVLEPLLILILGTLMLWVASSVLGPVYDIIGKLKI